MTYKNPITAYWSNETFLFFLGVMVIIVVSTMFVPNTSLLLSKSKRWVLSLKGVIPFCILLLVKGTLTCGRDLLNGYFLDFESATSFTNFRDGSLEFGYQLLNVMVRKVGNYYGLFVFIIAVLTLVPIFHVLNKHVSEIDVSMFLFLYVSIYYFPSFSTFRIYLASSLGFLMFDNLLQHKNLKALFWLLISVLIHTSSLVLLIPFMIMIFKHINKRIAVVGLLTLLIAMLIGRSYIASLFVGRYVNYSVSQSGQLGFQIFFEYAPLFLLLYFANHFEKQSNIFNKIALAYLSTGFVFGLMGYYISIFGRIESLFLPVIFIVAKLLRLIKNKHYYLGSVVNLLFIIYGIVRFVIYITSYYNLDDIMPYTNIVGWNFL